MSREFLVHPSNPAWRLRLHPTSRIFTRACSGHGPRCPDSSPLRLHHLPGTWTADERDAHPAWTHDLVDLCQAGCSLHSHRCDDVCGRFETLEKGPELPMNHAKSTIFDEIAYFHGSKHWDAHWESPPDFSLHPHLARMLNASQIALVVKHLRQIGEYFTAMECAGFFAKTAEFVAAVFRSAHPERPTYPESLFGAGFSGFDRIDERGWDRAGYEATEEHSPDDWGLRTSYQIAYFVALGRIFQMPAGHLVAYDPCYSLVDVVLLANLGVRALRKGDPGLKRLRKFTNPTLFYAPGAEQHVFTDAIGRADPIQNLIILGGDASWCGRRTADFTANYACMHVPGYVTTHNGESPCGEDNCLQWIPPSRVEAFNKARGPAREPPVRHLVMPDGSLQPDD
ncbi:SRR1 domain-containing protein [Mycena venus]|uniref:SRR1 domain-containing protein n=1 Tax=Mycena venus TaxID=2733690 RepID=A0A8H6XMZ1_9AGAR|nr:SRR1 domain-containing protein [Mycena venus]